jgi:hypothetical protein
MDMSLTVGINERLGYPTSRYRAIAYLKHRWGEDPYPLVNATSVIILPLLAFIFFVILPLMVVGLVRKNREILAVGFSCVIFCSVSSNLPDHYRPISTPWQLIAIQSTVRMIYCPDGPPSLRELIEAGREKGKKGTQKRLMLMQHRQNRPPLVEI